MTDQDVQEIERQDTQDVQDATLVEATEEPTTPAELPVATTTTLARNLPLSADTLMLWADRLESESERYTQWSPPHQALHSAAAQLRSAVGHVLTGKHAKSA
jgi:hypothetical protein